jgi:hypothetical protein
MSTYAWIIDRDHMPDTDAPEGSYLNAKGLTGPSTATDALLARLKAGEGVKFRMYDDDGEIYYTGRLVLADGDENVTTTTSEHYRHPIVNGGTVFAADESASFGPLRDFGTGNAGATEIRYRDAAGVWGSL